MELLVDYKQVATIRGQAQVQVIINRLWPGEGAPLVVNVDDDWLTATILGEHYDFPIFGDPAGVAEAIVESQKAILDQESGDTR